MKNIVIVGGGTAGWMTASYLSAAFGDRMSVTLVESDRVATIGVGEATFSTVRHFFEYLGLEEHEWMPSCNATYKLGIRFENWRAPGHYFYHPFERQRVVDGFGLTDWWLHNPRSDRFDQDCFLVGALCDDEKSPRTLDGSLFGCDVGEGDSVRTTLSEQSAQFPYAYHFDASLLANFLRDYAVRRGSGMWSTMSSPYSGTSEAGSIAFAPATTETSWANCSSTARVSRASCCTARSRNRSSPIRTRCPTIERSRCRCRTATGRKGLRPYTTATAQDAGWIWTIPLQGRTGTGYVYAEDYCTPEEAERTLRAFIGPGAKDLSANHIRMRIGRSRMIVGAQLRGDRALQRFRGTAGIDRHILHSARHRATGETPPGS